MSLAQLDSVSLAFAGTPILEDASLTVRAGERLGLIGPNGSGKTTVLRLLAGELSPDRGRVVRARDARLEVLEQEPTLEPGRSAIDTVMEGFADVAGLIRRLRETEEAMAAPDAAARMDELLARHGRIEAALDAAGGWAVRHRAEEALTGLGIAPDAHDRPVESFSGGQRTRIALARVLLREPAILLLDEPTNHLDVDAAEWLEARLRDWPGAVVVVSHDRWFLQQVVTGVVEVERRTLVAYPGDYASYEAQAEIRRATWRKRYEKEQEQMRRDADFVARNIVDKRTATRAKSRRKRLERTQREALAAPPEAVRPKRKINLGGRTRGGRDVVALRGVGHSWDGDRWLFRDVSLRIEAGEKIGVVGPNGGGKSTLLRIAAGRLDPTAGDRRQGPGTSLGIFDQDRADLDPEATALDHLRRLEAAPSDEELRSWLGRFSISGDDALRPVATLSGGEASRVALAVLVRSAPAALLLDEPTNHLDVGAREALEEALCSFPGAVFLVSHDRRLLDGVADRMLLVGDGAVRDFPGNYSALRERLAEERAEERRRQEEIAERARAERRRRAKEDRGAPRPKRVRREDVEAAIIEREDRLAAIDEEMAREAVYTDADAMRTLKGERERLSAELRDLDGQWEHLAS